MNLQQLEYILAVDRHRHFARAADACHVTQPTLSMMIKRLEEELEVRIFDRSRQPVMPTPTGELVLNQARQILRQVERLHELVDDARNALSGELRVGIIPTLAPYLLPRFLNRFLSEYPLIHLRLSEMVTENILHHLQRGELDAGILVGPAATTDFVSRTLFYEEFWVYTSHAYDKQYLLPEDIDPDELLLLEEGHCFRSQILNLCELRRRREKAFEYASGSIDTLKRLVETGSGLTILPELATLHLTPEEKHRLKSFHPPVPVREVSLLTHPDFVREGLLRALHAAVAAAVPSRMLTSAGRPIVQFERMSN